MSGKDDDIAPFGYSFDHSGSAAGTYPPPGDRPLLHDEENSFLENFFNDPNNVDPNTLTSIPSEFQDGAYHTGTDWRRTQAGGRDPSADVYAAAGILHSQAPARAPDAFGYVHQAVPDASRPNGYQYPPPSHPATFSGANTAPYMGQQPSADQRRVTLAFGSDDNFRNAEFNASAAENDDTAIGDVIRTALKSEGDSSRQSAHARKRAVQKPDDADSDDGEKRRHDEISSPNDADKRKKKPRQMSNAELSGDSSTPAKKARASAAKSARENLTEEQKRNNHIQSEQKRRNLIKQGFDDLNRMVPELRSGSLSKSNMLVEAAKFMRLLKEGNDALEAMLLSDK